MIFINKQSKNDGCFSQNMMWVFSPSNSLFTSLYVKILSKSLMCTWEIHLKIWNLKELKYSCTLNKILPCCCEGYNLLKREKSSLVKNYKITFLIFDTSFYLCSKIKSQCPSMKGQLDFRIRKIHSLLTHIKRETTKLVLCILLLKCGRRQKSFSTKYPWVAGNL